MIKCNISQNELEEEEHNQNYMDISRDNKRTKKMRKIWERIDVMAAFHNVLFMGVFFFVFLYTLDLSKLKMERWIFSRFKLCMFLFCVWIPTMVKYQYTTPTHVWFFYVCSGIIFLILFATNTYERNPHYLFDF